MIVALLAMLFSLGMRYLPAFKGIQVDRPLEERVPRLVQGR